jgi:hypothetical protein
MFTYNVTIWNVVLSRYSNRWSQDWVSAVCNLFLSLDFMSHVSKSCKLLFIVMCGTSYQYLSLSHFSSLERLVLKPNYVNKRPIRFSWTQGISWDMHSIAKNQNLYPTKRYQFRSFIVSKTMSVHPRNAFSNTPQFYANNSWTSNTNISAIAENQTNVSG